MLSFLIMKQNGEKQKIQRDAKKLLEVMDMSTTLIVMMVS